MKLTKKQLEKAIRRSLIKEFKSPNQIIPQNIDIPGLFSGDGFPPKDNNKEREGPENKCTAFQEIHEYISYLYGTLVEWFINKSIPKYQHLQPIQDVTDIPFEIAIADHGVYIAKELIVKCGRYNSNIIKFIKRPSVILGEDPEMGYNKNFNVPGIDRKELIHIVQVLRNSILRL